MFFVLLSAHIHIYESVDSHLTILSLLYPPECLSVETHFKCTEAGLRVIFVILCEWVVGVVCVSGCLVVLCK